MDLLAPTIILAALADSINPCAISVLFLTIAFLFGLGKERKDILKFGGVYILGIFVIYILIGLGILQTLSIFGVPRFISKMGAILLIAWGAIDLIGRIWPKFPVKLAIPDAAKPGIAKLIHKATFPSALALGVVVGMTEFPCTGGPYLFVLTLLHDKTTFLTGFAYLILYNIIFVSPLVILLWLASDHRLAEKTKEWKKANSNKAEYVGNLILIAMGLAILLFSA
jgi:cytochrome c biogenesis protein CcdA